MAQVSILLLLTLLTLVTFFPTTQAAYLRHFCGSNTTIFTPNSTYQSNLNTLLSSLSSNSTTPSGFHNATASNPATSETIYGLFLCRGDVTASTCKACVSNSTSAAMQRCPNNKDVVIFYDECMIRYSNKSFFSVLTVSPGYFKWNTGRNITTEAARFSQVLADSMADVAKAASNDGDRFATKEANFTGFIRLYSLGQCTPDLSSFDCNKCLKAAIYIEFSDMLRRKGRGEGFVSEL